MVADEKKDTSRYRVAGSSLSNNKTPKGKDYEGGGEEKEVTVRENTNTAKTLTAGATSAKEVLLLPSSPLRSLSSLRSSSLSSLLSTSLSSSSSSSVCYHGSSYEHFHNRDYAVCVQAYLEMRYDCLQQYGKDMSKKGLLNIASRKQQFDEEYDQVWNNNNHNKDVFCRFLFAYCVHLFLLTQGPHHKKEKKMVQTLLSLGIDLLYGELSESEVNEGIVTEFGPGSSNYEKNCKYNRDITNERGLIQCLSRETVQYCHCMTPHKIEANKKLSKKKTATRDGGVVTTTTTAAIVKVGVCFGCQQEFPKHTLSFCTGCDIHQYCGKQCQIKEWPQHKVLCKMVQAAKLSSSNSSSNDSSSSSSSAQQTRTRTKIIGGESINTVGKQNES